MVPIPRDPTQTNQASLLANQLANVNGQSLQNGGSGTTGQGINESGYEPDGSQQQMASALGNQNPAVQQANSLAQDANASTPASAGAPQAGSGAPAVVVAGGASQGNPVAGYPSVTQPYGNAYALANQITQKAEAGVSPKVIAGRKEIAKEGYNAQLKQVQDVSAQDAASRGLGGGWAEAQQQNMQAQAPLDLTNIYRGIDANAEQTGLQQLISAMGANQGLAGQVANEGLQGRSIDNQYNLGQGSLSLGNRQQDLTEANALYDRNNPLGQIIASLIPGYQWNGGGA